MSGRPPATDRAGSVLAAALALLGVSAFDVAVVALLPASARGFLAVAVPLACVLLLVLGLAAERPRAPWLRAACLLLAAAPALLAASLLAGGGAQGVAGAALPGLALLLCAVAPFALGGLPLRLRRGVAVLLLVAWGGDLALERAGLPLLPAALQPLRAPLLAQELASAPGSPPRATALRPGGLVEAGAAWPGLQVAASEGLVEGGLPVVRVLGGPAGAPLERAVLPGEPSREALWARSPSRPRSALELVGLEVVRVHADAWPEGPEAALHAAALAGYVRGGGVLVVGPGEPAGLAQALRAAQPVHGPAGVLGAQALGVGWVLRVPTVHDEPRLVAGALALPRAGTVLDVLGPPPSLPPGLAAGVRPPRALLGGLLLAWAVAVGLLEGGVSNGRRLLRLALPAAAALVAVVLALPRASDLRVTGVVLELGGAGGRRLEALYLEAGEGGWSGAVQWRAPCALRRLPGALAGGGRVQAWLAPGSSAWLVAEGLARGEPLSGGPPAHSPAWAALDGWAWGGAGAQARRGGQALELLALEGVDLPGAAVLALQEP